MELPLDKICMVSMQVGDPGEVRFELGDITTFPYDAIVNAANSELLPGGGVCGAIHHSGGPAIAEECRRIRADRGPLAPGQAVATTAGSLPAKHLIHTVGPIWQGGGSDEAKVLSNCYRESMRIADDLKSYSIAFPAISTGIFGYPVEQAARVAVPSVIAGLRSAKCLVFVSMVLFDKATLDAFVAVATAQRKPGSGRSYEIGFWDS